MVNLSPRAAYEKRYSMKLLFYIYKAKRRANGEAPIYAKISIQDKRPAQFSTGIYLKPNQWQSTGNGYVLGNDNLVKSYNEKLIDIRAEINGLFQDLRRREQVITPQLLKSLYVGGKAPTLSHVMNLLIDEKKKEGKARGTIKNYRIRRDNVLKYLFHRKDPGRQCSEININFLSDLEAYLRQELKHEQSHTNKILRMVRETLDLAVRKEFVDYNPLHSYKCKKVPRKKKIYLTDQEVIRMLTHQFASDRLKKIAYLFLIQCFTGFSYAELMRFKKSWIGPGVDGKEWIFSDRKKVEGSQCDIPLFDITKRLLEQFSYQIPPIANGNYNVYLKEIAFILGIEKNLTTHVARKTFGNLLLDKGVSLEAISAMYGHSTVKTTQNYYVEVSPHRIAKETANLGF